MTGRLAIRHVTTYRYDGPVSYGLQQVRLTPKSRPGQQVLEWATHVSGGRIETEFDDSHANRVQLLSLDPGVTEVKVVAEGVVEVTDGSGVIGQQGGYMPLWMFLRSTDRTRRGAGVMALARDLRGMGDELAQMHALSSAVREAVEYRTGSSGVEMTAEEILSAGAGVCQDHAHVFIACARALDRPARYVSGYLKMDDRDEQEATHAWAEAHVEGLGWVGFDVSNGISPDERYVRVATGLDYGDAAPIRGLRQGAGFESLDVHLTVTRTEQAQRQSQQGDGGAQEQSQLQ